MRRNIVVCLIILASLFGCGEQKSEEGETVPSNISKSPEYQEGLALVAKSDCFSCHKINQPAIGPSYVSIAEKYTNNAEIIDLLSGKIINGSVGVWGQIPMPPHSNLTKQDTEKMVKYILLLKK